MPRKVRAGSGDLLRLIDELEKDYPDQGSSPGRVLWRGRAGAVGTASVLKEPLSIGGCRERIRPHRPHAESVDRSGLSRANHSIPTQTAHFTREKAPRTPEAAVDKLGERSVLVADGLPRLPKKAIDCRLGDSQGLNASLSIRPSRRSLVRGISGST